MNILFVHEVSYVGKPIYEMHEFPELFSQQGHQVSFLQFAEGLKFWKKQRPILNSVIAGRVLSRAKINLSTPYQFGVPGLDRGLAFFTVIPLLLKLLRQRNFDVIVLYAVPTYAVQVLFLAHLFKVPVVFRALDVSHKIRKTIFSPAIWFVEKIAYRYSTLVSANNAELLKYCLNMGARNNFSTVDPPPLDIEHFRKRKVELNLKKNLGIGSHQFVIVFLGTFFRFSGLIQVIESLGKLARKDIVLLLLGGGEIEQKVKHLVKKLGTKNQVLQIGFVPYSEIPKYFSIADVAINPMEPTFVTDKAFPHKIVQYMAAGLPVVSTKLKGAYSTFGDKSGITWALHPEDVLNKAVFLCERSANRPLLESKQLRALEGFTNEAISLRQFQETLRLAIRLNK